MIEPVASQRYLIYPNSIQAPMPCYLQTCCSSIPPVLYSLVVAMARKESMNGWSENHSDLTGTEEYQQVGVGFVKHFKYNSLSGYRLLYNSKSLTKHCLDS